MPSRNLSLANRLCLATIKPFHHRITAVFPIRFFGPHEIAMMRIRVGNAGACQAQKCPEPTILACSDTFPHHVTLLSGRADTMSHTETLPESHVASQCISCALAISLWSLKTSCQITVMRKSRPRSGAIYDITVCITRLRELHTLEH